MTPTRAPYTYPLPLFQPTRLEMENMIVDAQSLDV